jgi:hypothetical protein
MRCACSQRSPAPFRPAVVVTLLGWLCFAGPSVRFAAAAENAILNELREQGVSAAGQKLVLPKPTLADGADAAAEKAAWAEIVDENHTVEALTHQAVVAPFVLKIADDPGEGKTATLRRLDLWFVAYGDLKKLSDASFVRAQASAAADAESAANAAGMLSADELRARGIDAPQDERFLTARLTLFDRVRISGTMEALLTRSPDSVLVAARLDPRFAEDKKFPNQWRSIKKDESGRTTAGDPHPYTAVGWYAKATRLRMPKGAILVEYHVVFDEPASWFNGANLLRSKLPIVVQDGVRKFRRQLAAGAP